MRVFFVLLLGGALAMSLARNAAAQTSTGSIRGYVTDSSGTPLEGARVVAVSALNGTQREVTTQARGFYAILGLTPGEYDVTARQIGMAPQRIHVRVLIGEVYPLDFKLATSAIQIEAVSVVAASGVETRTSEVATNVTRQQVERLPLSDRNFLDLVQLAPGTSIQNGGPNDTRKTFAAGALPADNVNVFIDGTSYKNDLTAGGVAGQDASRGNPFPLNAIQEFRVITQNYKAEYQKASSGIITATTKAGGTKWEGSAFFYGQGKGLLATDSLPCATATPSSPCPPQPKPDYARYQAGVSFGGPIVRDRLFFFGSYEGNTAIAKHRYVSGNWLNEAMVSFQHYRRNPTPTNPDLISRVYLNDIAGCCPTYALLGGSQSVQDYTQNRLTLRNDVSYSGLQWAGQHVIKAGASIDFAHYHIIKDNNGNPQFKYFPSDSFAFPREALMGAGNPDFATTNHQVGAYVQDDWNPTQRLQLNLGIRWDYESDMIDNGYVTPPGVKAALDTVVPSKYFTDGTQRPPFYGAFQPRVGFSYVLDEGGRWTVFGGFGVYYDRDLYDNVAIIEQYNTQHPNYNFFFFQNPADSAAGKVRWNNSYLSKQGLLGLLSSGQTGLPELELIANDTKPPKSNQWSVGVRRLLGPYALSATYTGLRSNHGFTYMCHNAFRNPNPTQSPNCFGSPAPGLTGNVFLSSDAVQTWYDAVYLQAQRPYSQASHWGAGLTYTWAKGTQTGGGPFRFDYRFPTDYPHYPAPGVQRNSIVGNWIVDVPLGIQFSGLLTLGSGVPFQIGGPENGS